MTTKYLIFVSQGFGPDCSTFIAANQKFVIVEIVSGSWVKLQLSQTQN